MSIMNQYVQMREIEEDMQSEWKTQHDEPMA
jgi:hypothetical protein